MTKMMINKMIKNDDGKISPVGVSFVHIGAGFKEQLHRLRKKIHFFPTKRKRAYPPPSWQLGGRNRTREDLERFTEDSM